MKHNNLSALFCDLYHISMAQAMFDKNTHNQIETYEMFIRKAPFGGSYLIAAGLAEVLKWLSKWQVTDYDIEFLKKQGFKDEFLKMMKDTKLSINMEAFREGEIVFPNEPIVRVTGPAWQAMIVETAILNIINAQSLIATKASRIKQASMLDGKERKVLEMGLRRSQDMGGFVPTRASYIGGVDITSNVEAARYYNIPVAGTMAHCFIMRENNEFDAFKNYLTSFPDNGSILIDTYDTIEGAKIAIKASIQTGVKLSSVRLDSGDLGYLSKEVRKLLDDAGMSDTKITASNDLNEKTIKSLILEQKAPIDIFGVGTMLVTAYDQPALGGVYKLKKTGNREVIKISEDAFKTTIPGPTNVIRILNENGKYDGDIIYSDENLITDGKLNRDIISIDIRSEKLRKFKKGNNVHNPIISVVENGIVNEKEINRSLSDIKNYAAKNLNMLDESHLRFENPHIYVAGLEKSLFNKRNNMHKEILLKEEKER